MGYDLHITRAADWTESEDAPITAEEWLVVVAADPEMTIFSANGPYFAVWNGTGQLAESWLDWSEGQVFTKNPTRRELAKMLQIAGRLGAKVIGDEGEVYARIEDLPNGGGAKAPAARRWWKFWSR
jgi:hypothetical protein